MHLKRQEGKTNKLASELDRAKAEEMKKKAMESLGKPVRERAVKPVVTAVHQQKRR